jgi:competence protein ComEC
VVGGLFFGLWRGAILNTELIAIENHYGQTIIIDGNVREDVDTDAAGQLTIRLDTLRIAGKDIPGTLWVNSKTDVDIKRSDKLTIEGKIDRGFGSFVGTMYRAKIMSVKRPEPGDVARVVRDWFADGVRTAIPEPQASLGIGYLVGQKRALPNDLVEALQIAGLTHIVVASGYNLTILVRLARRLFEKVSKYLSALSSSIMIASFIAITGLSPSMSRAGLVAGLSLAAWYYGRRFHPLVLLSFAAVITVIINPSYIWGDLGWQLSFAAFGGVMILAPLLQRFFFGEKKPGVFRQILGETIAAIIVTAPLLISAFGQFSNVAIIANLLILPFVPLAMLLTFIAGIAALVIPTASTIIGLPATWLLSYMTNVAEYLSHLSWAVTTVQISSFTVTICYFILIAICIYLWRITKFDLRNTNLIE